MAIDISQKVRKATQTIAWFWDLYKRGLLELDPPYQRRSVWNQAYKDFFVETILLGYPAPALFLYETISAEGVAQYSVVDGKQRLTTIFEFADDLFPVADNSALERYQGKSFSHLGDDTKRAFWRYEFSVEYVPTTDEETLNNIFDRINRNVSKLTRQELRHARFNGVFATKVEELTELLKIDLPADFPRIAASSRRQMKDVELVAQLLLLLESGPQSFSQDELDGAYSDRDTDWDERHEVEERFREILVSLREMISAPEGGALAASRLRNQADFYSLFGALDSLHAEYLLPGPEILVDRLSQFVRRVEDEETRASDARAKRYFEAARSASNDLNQRKTRIEIIKEVVTTGA